MYPKSCDIGAEKHEIEITAHNRYFPEACLSHGGSGGGGGAHDPLCLFSSGQLKFKSMSEDLIRVLLDREI